MKTIRGFTLIELMVVIAVLGIIVAIAIPSFREMTAENRQLSASTELTATFNNARNSAITLSRDVEIKAVDGDWMKGWTVKALPYTGVGVDGTITDYPEKTLFTHDALPVQLTVTADDTTFQYNRQGRLTINAENTITICDDRTAEKGRQFSLEPIGRVSVTRVNCE